MCIIKKVRTKIPKVFVFDIEVSEFKNLFDTFGIFLKYLKRALIWYFFLGNQVLWKCQAAQRKNARDHKKNETRTRNEEKDMFLRLSSNCFFSRRKEKTRAGYPGLRSFAPTL